jgi:hypothetical protein
MATLSINGAASEKSELYNAVIDSDGEGDFYKIYTTSWGNIDAGIQLNNDNKGDLLVDHLTFSLHNITENSFFDQSLSTSAAAETLSFSYQINPDSSIAKNELLIEALAFSAKANYELTADGVLKVYVHGGGAIGYGVENFFGDDERVADGYLASAYISAGLLIAERLNIEAFVSSMVIARNDKDDLGRYSRSSLGANLDLFVSDRFSVGAHVEKTYERLIHNGIERDNYFQAGGSMAVEF